MVERVVCGRLHDGLFYLWQAITFVLLHISLGLDNLNKCDNNGMNIELLIDFQFIRNVIRGIIVVVWLCCCCEMLSECFLPL
jgi:hypothetical protein